MAVAVPTEVLTVKLNGAEHPFPTLSMPDRRGRKPYRVKTFCLLRGIERVLFHIGDGSRSTGAFDAHLASVSMGEAQLIADRAAEKACTITEEELSAGTVCPCAPFVLSAL